MHPSDIPDLVVAYIFVASCVWVWHSQSQFLLRSFSSAGDKEALINDRYQRLQRGKGLAVPERLGALRIPLKIAAGLPALPVGLLKTANKVYELGKEASDRSASRQVIKVRRPFAWSMESDSC